MSRSTSLTFREALFAQQTDEAILILLTLDHDDLGSPIRVSSDSVDTISNSETFYACPFQITLPDERDEHVTEARLTIDNVDRVIVTALRSVSSPPEVTIQIVLGSDPDTIEAEWNDFLLKDTDYDDLVVTGRLSLDHLMNEPIPGDVMDPSRTPGLF